MKPLAVHSQARAEIRDITQSYESKLAGLGSDFRVELTRILDLIQSFPDLGSPYRNTDVRFLRLRRFPYVVFYQNREHRAFVIAVSHAKRRPGYWRKRLSTNGET